jgi:Tfp pilus assembly protein PilF
MTRFRSTSRLSFVRFAVVVSVVTLAQAGCDRPASSGNAAGASSATEASLVQKGLDLLYKTGDALAAVDTFRAVLKANPTHYGARFQLAKALDLSGKPAEARPIWEQVLGAAEAVKDTVTSSTARMRLAQPDTASQVGMMNQGLNLLYAQFNPSAAAEQFRKVLERNPTHYGATFQLAKALDQAGKPDEARPYWEKSLTMAEGINDRTTADAARARLQQK